MEIKKRPHQIRTHEIFFVVAFATLVGFSGTSGFFGKIWNTIKSSPSSLVAQVTKLCDPTKPPVLCSALASTWTSGTASCREDASGYDVSLCERPYPMPYGELVKPGLRDSARWKDARCNDGSPFAFEVELSKTGSDEWVIWLEGGGFCDDNAKSCADRSSYLMGTIPGDDKTLMTFEKTAGIFNRSELINETFHNANFVYAHYCSSDIWSGSSARKRFDVEGHPEGWYFSGNLNIRAMIETLKQRFGIDDNNADIKMLFTGSSAGGDGVITNASTVKNILPKMAERGNLKIVGDGSFIPAFDHPDFRPGSSTIPIIDAVVRNYDFWVSKLNPLCEASMKQNGLHPGNCFIAAIDYPFLTEPEPRGLELPYLVQYSSIDENNTDLHHIDDFTDPYEVRALEEWRRIVLASFKNVARVFSGGLYRYHTIITKDDDQDGLDMGPAEGMTFRDVLTRFWNGDAPEKIIYGNPVLAFVMGYPPKEKICEYPVVLLNGREDLIENGDIEALEIARSCGTKVYVKLEETPDILNKNGVGINIKIIKQKWDDFAGIIDPYVEDGTIIGHLIADDPHLCDEWGGTCPTRQNMDELGRISKSHWPALSTILSTIPPYAENYTWQFVDKINFPYGFHKGNIDDFIDHGMKVFLDGGVADIGWSMQALRGGCAQYDECPMTPDQVLTIGKKMCTSGGGTTIGFSRYDFSLLDEEMADAVQQVEKYCLSINTR